jgi:hypothetical protein
MDWSSPEGRIIVAARAELTAHVGGNPNRVEKVLIERAARLMLYIEMIDAQALKDGTMSDSRQYLAWINALRLCLREIGLKKSIAARPVGLDDIVADKRKMAPERTRPRRLVRSRKLQSRVAREARGRARRRSNS